MAQQTRVAIPLLEKIRQRGYWRVVIRPGRFERERFPDIAALYPLLQDRAVRLRGWAYPLLDEHRPYRTGLDWIDQESEWGYHLEYWRFYQSGQFIDYAGLDEDWRGQPPQSPTPPEWQPGRYLPILDTLYRFTEIFEFAARLALTDAYGVDDTVHVELLLRGLHGRRLYADTWPRTPMYLAGAQDAHMEEFPYKADLRRDELIANAHQLALGQAQRLFDRFKWEPTKGLLQGIQAEFVRS